MINSMKQDYKSYLKNNGYDNVSIDKCSDKKFNVSFMMRQIKNFISVLSEEERSIIDPVLYDLYNLISSTTEDSSNILEFLTGYLSGDINAYHHVGVYLEEARKNVKEFP